MLERRNGLVHATVFALPEPASAAARGAGALALPPPTALEFRQPVAAPDSAGSAFGAEAEAPPDGQGMGLISRALSMLTYLPWAKTASIKAFLQKGFFVQNTFFSRNNSHRTDWIIQSFLGF